MELGFFLKSLLKVAIIVEVLCSCQTVGKKLTVSALGSFLYISCSEDNSGEINVSHQQRSPSK